MFKYEYYYVQLNDGKYLFKTNYSVVTLECARKFTTKAQARNYAKKYYELSEFTVCNGGKLIELPDYEY